MRLLSYHILVKYRLYLKLHIKVTKILYFFSYYGGNSIFDQTFYYYISDSWQMEKISLFKWRIFCPVFGHLTYKSNHGIPFFSNRIKYSKINIVCGKENFSSIVQSHLFLSDWGPDP